ncbi:MAG TPA: sporulation membrane protein YtaF [Bacillales bacterium]|nr:sporulation membrane protein YtaF [Bacillales bacterium]
MHLFSMIFIAFALSLDSFNVGTTYGMRKMHIPATSILIIACCSGLVLFASMGFGHLLSHLISPHWAKVIGGLILVILGLWALIQFLFSKQKNTEPREEEFLLNVEFKKLGIVIQVLRKPMTADLDHSGTISKMEAILLGTALSLDAFGAGIGAALVNYPSFWMSLTVSIMSGLCLAGGKQFGNFFTNAKWMKNASLFSGLLLILIGIWKM